MPQQFQNLVSSQPLSFGSAGSVSNAVYLNGEAILAVGVPGTWTTAPLTFQVSAGAAEPGTWYAWYVGTTEAMVYPAIRGTSLYYLNVGAAAGIQWIRGFSGTASANAGTQQAAAREILLLTRPVAP